MLEDVLSWLAEDPPTRLGRKPGWPSATSAAHSAAVAKLHAARSCEANENRPWPTKI